MAQTDPLYWARARAAELADPFGRPIDPEASTEEFPSVRPEWSGRLPLPAPDGLPARRPWSAEDATTDSLPAIRSDDAATTVDLPAVPSAAVPSAAETVDYRDRPLVPARTLAPRPERSTLARRGYTGRHRPPETTAPTRLGLSTAGMTVAVGVLGVALAVLHVQPNTQADRSTPPLSAVSPTGGPDTGADDGAPATEPRPTPGPSDQHLIPRPASTPGSSAAPTPAANGAQVPAVAPEGDDGDDEGTEDEPDSGNTPRTRPTRPSSASRPTTRPNPRPTRCAVGLVDRGTVRTNALAADDTTTATGSTQADPEESPSEPTEAETEEPTAQPSPSAATPCR